MKPCPDHPHRAPHTHCGRCTRAIDLGKAHDCPNRWTPPTEDELAAAQGGLADARAALRGDTTE